MKLSHYNTMYIVKGYLRKLKIKLIFGQPMSVDYISGAQAVLGLNIVDSTGILGY